MKHLKQEFDRLSFKEVIIYSISVICLGAAIVAIFLSLYIEPAGEVHASVLTYFGISSAFCGSLLGISEHYSTELARFKSSVIDSLPAVQSGGQYEPARDTGMGAGVYVTHSKSDSENPQAYE